MKATGILAIVILVIIGAFVGINYINYSNEEIALRNQIEAQEESNGAYFDAMWKIIQQQAEVSDKYRESFKDIYVGLIEGRYQGNGNGQLMNWIQESNPNFDTSLYGKLMTSIEAERKSFFVEQKKLIDLSRAHENLLEVFPSSVFLSGRDHIEITIIKSAKTEEVFSTGKEEIEPLFK